MESKQLFFLALTLGCVASGMAAPPKTPTATLPEEKMTLARQALEGATSTLQSNLVASLTSLANSSAIAGQNVSRAAAVMIRGLVTNTFSLGGVVAYMPRLIFLDGPTQFIETLRLVRANQIRVPNDINSAIDTLLVFAAQVRDSGVGANFQPLVTFFPNLFAGVGDFLTTMIDSVFTFIAPATNAVSTGAVPVASSVAVTY